MAAIITIENQIQCPHGGMAILTTTNESLTVDGSPALLESDIPTISGCTFNVSGAPSPCLTIQWTAGAESLSVDGVGVVLESSIGLCSNAAGAPQGTALISDSTPEVDAL